MTIPEALTESARELHWTPTRVAIEAGVTEYQARRWLSGKSVPGSDKLLLLISRMPGLHARVFAGAAIAPEHVQQ